MIKTSTEDLLWSQVSQSIVVASMRGIVVYKLQTNAVKWIEIFPVQEIWTAASLAPQQYHRPRFATASLQPSLLFNFASLTLCFVYLACSVGRLSSGKQPMCCGTMNCLQSVGM